MKFLRGIFLSMVLALGVTAVYADGCLNEYNNCLLSCDSTGFGRFTQWGCKVDCWNAYYYCLLYQATN